MLPRFLLVDYYDSFLNNFKKVFIFIIFIYTWYYYYYNYHITITIILPLMSLHFHNYDHHYHYNTNIIIMIISFLIFTVPSYLTTFYFNIMIIVNSTITIIIENFKSCGVFILTIHNDIFFLLNLVLKFCFTSIASFLCLYSWPIEGKNRNWGDQNVK